ncbi:MAG: SCO family protein [Gemmatimonadota bacterium]
MSPRIPTIAILACLITVACERPAPPDPGAFAGSPLAEPVTLPDRVFPTMEGDEFHLARDTRGQVTLLFIGYTYCPDICPVHLANLAAVLDDLPLEVTRDVRTIFLTADPARDTPARLQEWLGALDRSFVGLRGTRDQVNALEDALGLPRSVVEPGDDPEEYFVGHAGQVLAFDRTGVARLAYPWGIRQRDWRRDLPRLVRGEWPEASAPGADRFSGGGR